MKKNLKLIVLFLIIYISFIGKGLSKTMTPVELHGKLSVEGTNIVDKNGNIFQLRGVSTHGVAWFPQYINQDIFNYIKENWGANVVRLSMYSDPSAGYNKSLHEKVKEGINYAINTGLYVIVDWHILNDGNPNIHKNEAINFFKEISTLYKDYPNIIYEICNEPNGNVEWEKDIKPYAKDLIDEIRKIDDDAIILVGTPTWSQDVDIVSKSPLTGYKNIMYTLHFYAASHKENLRNKLQTALNNNLPIFISEFGLCDASGAGNINYDEADKWMDIVDKNNISYVMWQLSNKNECSSLIRSDITKLSNWTYDELSEQGKWLTNTLKKYKTENESIEIDYINGQEIDKIEKNIIEDEHKIIDSNKSSLLLAICIFIVIIISLLLTFKSKKRKLNQTKKTGQ